MDKPLLHREFVRWAIITIGGTVSLFYVGSLQRDLQSQQHELALHQVAIFKQNQINESLRIQNSNQIGDALLKLCIEEYRIDGKLAKLGIDLLQSPVLNKDVKAALEDFSSEVSQNQGSLQCINPVRTAPRKKE
jgi:hypothetical protein